MQNTFDSLSGTGVPDDSRETPAACVACNRRDFVANSVLLAVGGLLAAACGDGVIGSGGGSTITGPVDLTVKLSDYPALANVGGIARISGVRTPIAVVRNSSTSYLAFSLVCPHERTTVNINGSGFLCPNHGARFNASGTWTGGQRTGNLSRLTGTLDSTAGTLTIA